MLMALFDTTRGGCRIALQAKPARLAMMLVWEGARLDPVPRMPSSGECERGFKCVSQRTSIEFFVVVSAYSHF